MTISAGGTATVTVSLSGTVPTAGRYEGLIAVSGGAVPLNIPYLFVVGDGTPYDVIPLNGTPPGFYRSTALLVNRFRLTIRCRSFR